MPKNAGCASDRLPTCPTTRSYDRASAANSAVTMNTCRTYRCCRGTAAATSHGAPATTATNVPASAPRTSDSDPTAEEALRPPQQHRDHDQERDRVLVGIGDVAPRQRLGDADQEARRDGAVDVAEA